MEQIDDRMEFLHEINNMYIVHVTVGKYTRKGSLLVFSEDGQEFFATKQFVESKISVFESLSKGKKPLWILAKDYIWGGKWNNKLVSEIVVISENKTDCEKYKALLHLRQELKYDLFELNKQRLKIIEMFYGKPSYIEEDLKVQKEISSIKNKLSELDIQLDDDV